MINEIPSHISKLRTSAFFSIKAAASMVDTNYADAGDVEAAINLLERAKEKLSQYDSERSRYLEQYKVAKP